MNNKKIAAVVGGLILVIALGSVVKNSGKKEEKLEINYITKKASKTNGKGYVEVEGKIEANDTKKVFVDKRLKVKEVYIQEGDYVEKDQLLMIFDETERNNIMRNLRRQELNLSKIERNLEVEKELLALGGSSKNYIKELEEEVEQYQINIEEHKEDLEKTAEFIKSPVSGTVTSLYAQENYSVNTDDPLLELADLSDMKIVLEVAEYDVKDIYMGQKLSIKPEIYEKKKGFDGEVTKISKIARSSSTTSENVIEVEVKPLEVIPDIVPGFKVSATIYLKESKGIVLLKTSVLEEEGKYFVFITDSKNKAVKKYVEIERLGGESLIVTKGLEVGEEVIVNPTMKLKEGEVIKKRGVDRGGKGANKNKPVK